MTRSSHEVHVVLTPVSIAALVLAILIPSGIALYLGCRAPRAGGGGETASEPDVLPSPMVQTGPWGILHIEPIILDCPSAQTLNDLDLTPYRQWLFRVSTRAELRQQLADAGLEPRCCDELAPLAAAAPDGKSFVLHAPDAIVRGLTPEQRATLYAILSRNSANLAQNMPFCFRGSSIHEWFAGSSIPMATVERIEPLLYKRGHYLMFSDPQLVLPEISARYERLELIRTLRRMSTLRVRVCLKPGERPDSILAYWGGPNRTADIEPMLPSLAARKDGLGLGTFLPPFARTRLYTYPKLGSSGSGATCNCHWTSLNFFNDPPDDRIATDANLAGSLDRLYEPLDSMTRLGDVVLLFHGNELVHSCVYIAGDVVFTKNGAGTIAPFILQRLDDVVDGYREMYGPIKLGFCRRKGT